jgi:hypothetical protein
MGARRRAHVSKPYFREPGLWPVRWKSALSLCNSRFIALWLLASRPTCGVAGKPTAACGGPMICKNLCNSHNYLNSIKKDNDDFPSVAARLGLLALAVFGYVCKQGGQGVKKLFSAATLEEYSAEIGRPVGAEEIQKVATLLVDSNILARDGHGIYGVSDPFLAEAYSGRANVFKTLDGAEAQP